MNFNLAKVLTLSLTFYAFNAAAQAPEAGGELPADAIVKYGTAGCGLGSMAFGDHPGFAQVFASTTNGFGMQTFAISSGTSNCKFGRYEAMSFIDVNRVALAKDVVHGDGEALESFAKLIGCPAPVLGAKLKQNYDSVFATPADPVQTGAAIIELIRAEPKLQTCSALTLG